MSILHIQSVRSVSNHMVSNIPIKIPCQEKSSLIEFDSLFIVVPTLLFTGKVIKKIEGTAFQTNLLTRNAAVRGRTCRRGDQKCKQPDQWYDQCGEKW